jgi:hypothetical protein
VKRISYADSKIATHDRVADLVLEYAKILARTESADTVTIPYRTDAGELAEVTMLIGPASQVTASTDDDDDFPGDPGAAIAELEERIRARTPQNMATQERLPADEFDDDDFDDYSETGDS